MKPPPPLPFPLSHIPEIDVDMIECRPRIWKNLDLSLSLFAIFLSSFHPCAVVVDDDDADDAAVDLWPR